MENQQIIFISKAIAALSFLLGNIFLFGYIFTKDFLFASSGYHYLLYAFTFNILIVAGLLIYGLIHKPKRRACIKSIIILSINIPVAFVYAVIGLNLI